MKLLKSAFAILMSGSFIFSSCNNGAGNEKKSEQDSMTSTATDSASIKEEPVTYSSNGTTLKGYITYDASKQGKRPIVLVVPEWWGLTDYPRMRAKELAQLGYLAMAVDMYGDGKIANNPDEAQKETSAFYTNPQEGKARIDAALAKAKTYPQADTSQTAAIGYCFGGSMVLNAAKLGGQTKTVFDRQNIEDLETELKKAKLVSKDAFPDNVVRLNSKVKIKEENRDNVIELMLVTPDKADIKQKKISVMAPIGTALIGFQQGEKVAWQVPSGNKTFTIMEVINQFE